MARYRNTYRRAAPFFDNIGHTSNGHDKQFYQANGEHENRYDLTKKQVCET
jgi:hypothetical protein